MSRHVLVIGEALVDVVHRGEGRIDESPGGSPANVALALGRLGDTAHFLTQLGDDPHGQQVREWLTKAGVRVTSSATTRTATATAHLDDSGSARYEFDISWSLDEAAPAGSDDLGIVHTGSIAALMAPGAAVVRAHLAEMRETSLITYDPNVRPALLPDHRRAVADVESFVGLADLVKASDEDLAWLYPGIDLLDVARSWLQQGPSVIVVTKGASGAFAVTRDGVTHVPGRQVEVVDTVGAGDTFMSALIHGLLDLGLDSADSRETLRGIDTRAVAELLRFSARAAAVTVSRPGADPPLLGELATLAPG
ncbi:carbohydrate kinase [Microbacterium sp. MYb45]|uniref:carbohydrate kinase family protein n=1 Tax=Microbacterium sp. MYb45 TaxID=1827294 RepID=UPI000CFF86B5|nr:carbohydrate kinase [Microbacterium sp. MYb45]PRB59912.1 carbohydrate kinase [Microbacterium sp. MYb45]